MKVLKHTLVRLSRVLSLAAALAVTVTPACSDGGSTDDDGSGGGDDESSGGRVGSGGREGSGGSAGEAIGGGAGEASGGSAGEASGGSASDENWVVGGWIATPEAWFGILGVVNDLSSDNSLELDNVVQFNGDFTYTAHKGAIYVGHQQNPVIEKWVLEDGELQKKDEVSFAAFGVTDTDGGSSNVIQIIDDETGWFFDHANARVIIFDPSDMSTSGSMIDYSEILEDIDFDVDWPDLGDVGRVGDYVAVPMYWYHWVEEGVEPIPLETRIALIDTTDNSVKVAIDNRCSGSSVMTNDKAGNLYFGPHAAAAGWSFEGEAGETVPCIIRILKGESEVDQDYLIDLNSLTDNAQVSGLFGGPGDWGYLYVVDGEPGDSDISTLYNFELGADEPELNPVPGYQSGEAGGLGFKVQVGGETKHFITYQASEGPTYAYYELKEDGSAERALGFTTYPGPAVNP